MFMDYNERLDGNEIMRRAQRKVWEHALLRPEVGVILAISIIMTGLSLLKIFWFPDLWWVWVVFGVLGASALVLISLRDQKFKQKITVELFYDQFNTTKLRTEELKKLVTEALQYHHAIHREISKLNAPLGMVLVDMDEWVTNVYNVAKNLDAFVKDPKVLDYLKRLMELRDAKPASTDTVDAAALLNLDDSMPLMNDYQLEMFKEMKATVIGTTEQLTETLAVVKTLHERVGSLYNFGVDSEFARSLRTSLTEQLEKLDKAYRSVDRLFHHVRSADLVI